MSQDKKATSQKTQCIKLTINGAPTPKGRPRFARRGNAIMTYTPDKTTKAQNEIGKQALDIGCDPFSGAVALRIDFYMPIPKSTPKNRLEGLIMSHHAKRPDADNLAKLVMDSLNGIFWADDSQIAELTITKRYCTNPRTEVVCNTL